MRTSVSAVRRLSEMFEEDPMYGPTEPIETRGLPLSRTSDGRTHCAGDLEEPPNVAEPVLSSLGSRIDEGWLNPIELPSTGDSTVAADVELRSRASTPTTTVLLNKIRPCNGVSEEWDQRWATKSSEGGLGPEGIKIADDLGGHLL
jgi:hypothetical protein